MKLFIYRDALSQLISRYTEINVDIPWKAAYVPRVG